MASTGRASWSWCEAQPRDEPAPRSTAGTGSGAGTMGAARRGACGRAVGAVSARYAARRATASEPATGAIVLVVDVRLPGLLDPWREPQGLFVLRDDRGRRLDPGQIVVGTQQRIELGQR